MFTAIAPRYDLLNRLLSGWADMRWRNFSVRWLPAPAKIILDIGTGTGEFALTALKRNDGAKTIGVDLSERMLRLAQRKTSAKGIDERCAWLMADGVRLPFREESVDAILCAFVIRNFEDLDEGLREMNRVLKSGGVVLVLEFCQPPPSWWWTPIGLFVRHFIPFVGRVMGHSTAYAYLTASIQTFLPAKSVAEKMVSAGFREVIWVPLTFGTVTFFRAVK